MESVYNKYTSPHSKKGWGKKGIGMTETKKKDNEILPKIINLITTIMVVVVVALAIVLVGFRLVGFDTYVVLSGSMEPVHKTGALIYARDAEPTELMVGDVITFQLADSETIVTHRIIGMEGEGESLQFTTKGDANKVTDPSPVPADRVIGKVTFSIPYMGYVANFIQTPPGLYYAAAAGVILVALMFLSDMLVEDDKKKKKKKSEKKKGVSK